LGLPNKKALMKVEIGSEVWFAGVEGFWGSCMAGEKLVLYYTSRADPWDVEEPGWTRAP
jgi:hypothetical protein